MAVNSHDNNSLSLTLDAAQFNCQVIDLKFKPPANGKPKLVRTACPDGVVAEPGEAQPGTLTGNVYADAADDGVTDVLLAAQETGAEIAYVLTLWNDIPAQATRWTGTATVDEIELGFEKPGKAKHPVSMSIATAVRSRPA